MNLIVNKKIVVLVMAFLAINCINAKSKKEDKKPNVLFFLVDDLGWMDVGYNGSEFYETPNIDKLASEGMVFNNAYATHPRCVPSRYSLITGRYPARAQMPGPGEGKLLPHGKVVKDDEHTIASALKARGYATFFAGKWHLAYKETLPEHIGFDVNIAGGHAGSPISFFYPYNFSSRKTKKAPILGLEEGEVGEYLTDRITVETITWLKNQKQENPEQPFLLYISHYAVHEPLDAKEEHIKKFEKKLKSMKYTNPEFIDEGTGTTKMRQDDPRYAGMVYSMDESLGKIKQTLADLGELDNTIIIFFSDNGGLSNNGNKPRRVATSNYPLRAGKGHLYEGGTREPMIVQWPGVTKAGSESEAIVTGADFFPTILEMTNAPLLPKSHIDGESFAWALKGKKDKNPDRTIFWHSPADRPHATGDSNSTAIRKGKFKLIEFYDQGIVELYNLEEDMEEQNNLADKFPEITSSMLKELHDWRKDVNAYIKKK